MVPIYSTVNIKQVGNNYITHGENSPIAGHDLDQTNNKNPAPSKKKWWEKILDEFIKNIVQYAVVAGISFISGLGIGKSCNLPKSQDKPQQHAPNNERDKSPKKN